MKPNKTTIAYIDGANLHRGVLSLGWKIDYARFRTWLSHRYGVGEAYLFIGLIPKHKDLYTYLSKSGFTLIYKEVVYDGDGRAKGNCDADLITQAMRDTYEGTAEQSILVTSDGDYVPLVKFLMDKGKLVAVLSPAPVKKCSILLKRTGVHIVYLEDKKALISAQNEKAPSRNASLQGSFS
ncbi:MAG: NYN domain-containing protein [bacterium]|nr:NYN domain-containing protein [bacterium]